MTDAVYVNGSSIAADHDVDGWRRVRILLDPQLLEHDLRQLHRSQLQQHRGQQPLVLRWRRRVSSERRLLRRRRAIRATVWTVGTHHDWFPLPGLRFAVDVMYTGIEIGDRRPDDHPEQGAGRSSDRRLHRQGPGHHLGHLPRPAHLGRRTEPSLAFRRASLHPRRASRRGFFLRY